MKETDEKAALEKRVKDLEKKLANKTRELKDVMKILVANARADNR